jgi:hypothetical protein
LASDDVCRRSGAELGPEGRTYRLRVLNETLAIDPAARRVERVVPPAAAAEEAPDDQLALASVAYLLSAQEMALAGRWVSPLELPTGAVFLRGPHVLPTQPLEDRFGASADVFRRACESLGGQPLDLADVSYRFLVFPRLPAAVLLWLADDEFDARATFLFDKTAGRQMALDSLWLVTHLLTTRLINTAQETPD